MREGIAKNAESLERDAETTGDDASVTPTRHDEPPPPTPAVAAAARPSDESQRNSTFTPEFVAKANAQMRNRHVEQQRCDDRDDKSRDDEPRDARFAKLEERLAVLTAMMERLTSRTDAAAAMEDEAAEIRRWRAERAAREEEAQRERAAQEERERAEKRMRVEQMRLLRAQQWYEEWRVAGVALAAATVTQRFRVVAAATDELEQAARSRIAQEAEWEA